MDNTPNKLGGNSLDISNDNRAKLKAILPSVFTETVNDKGELVQTVDFEKLKAELGAFTDLFESRRERYGMDWPGKKEALKLIQTPSFATLKPCREESVNFDTTENLFIEGDNLEVLKLLQKSYYGKVKMIYIDPPYNTGNEFIYPDNYSESLETYLEYAGLIDGEGKKFSTNTASEGRFHTKWLNMMYPRLYLARNLLRDDGVIFISIDDNEVANLKKLCDEIFGEENFIAELVWKKRVSPANDSQWYSSDHEYLLVFAKNKNLWQPNKTQRTEDHNQYYKNPDNDSRGPWNSAAYTCNKSKSERPNLYYAIVNPNTGEEIFPNENAVWAYSKETHLTHVAEKLLYWGSDGKSKSPRKKQFLTEAQPVVPRSVWDYQEVGSTQTATTETRDLFDGASFTYPKSVGLLKKAIYQGTSSDSIILDFFSGSSTIAHAMLDLNNQDGGKRKFICVQLPEPCGEGTEAYKAGYKTIADIGKDRIRRVIRNLIKENEGKLNFNEKDSRDYGFKVLKLAKSNFKQWQKLVPDSKPDQIEKQLEMHIDHIDKSAKPEDLLYEILIKAGFAPTEKVKTIQVVGTDVYSIADGALLICLAKAVSKELINAVAETEPMQFICLDSAFGENDQLKANAVQTFAARNMGRDKANQVVFRTV